MSLLTTREINELIDPASTKKSIQWTNNQVSIQCVECRKNISPPSISIMYKCDSIDTYTLYCVCSKCIQQHLISTHVKRTYEKTKAIRHQNKLQHFESQDMSKKI
jgi:hypothetical protein